MELPSHLSPEDAEAGLVAASKEDILRGGLKEFVRQAWPLVEGNRPLKWNWHIEAICDHLEALYLDKLDGKRKLLANVPPRTSKSTLLSVMFPVWVWTLDPSRSFIFASYSFTLSRDHAYKRRAILESQWFKDRWGDVVSMSGDRNNIAEMANNRRGMMYTTSVGATTTGRGGDILILDDPNSAEEMESEVQRASALRWVDVTWSTRMNDPSNYLEILIQQRTHTQDVTGHVLRKSRGEWCHLYIPMEFNPEKRCVTPIWHDPRTSKGELLDSSRFPQRFVDQKKIDLGPYFYAGQYDQEPYPLGGGIIKSQWLRPWRPSDKQPGYISIDDGAYHFDPFAHFRFATVDPAVSDDEIGEKKLSDPDYTVIAAWCVFSIHDKPALVLMDLIRKRLEGPDIIPAIAAMDRYWKFSVIGVETVAFQKTLFQQAKRDGLPVREISTRKNDDAIYRIDKDKVARAMASTPLLADRRFFIPEYAPWLADFVNEAIQFPNAAHDDMVDVLAYAVAIAQKYTAHDFALAKRDAPRRITDSAINKLDEVESTERRSPWDAIRVRSPR